MLNFSHENPVEILHGTSSGFSGLHFGLAEQLTARRDPHRLTYLQLESRVRRAWQGMGKETGGVQLTPRFGMIWSTYVKMTMDLCFLEL